MSSGYNLAYQTPKPYQLSYCSTTFNHSLSNSPTKTFKTINTPSEPTATTQVKALRQQYELKIIELENEIKFLKQQVSYKKQVHEREVQNIKTFMQYEYTAKVRDMKNSLREQYMNHLNENTSLKEKVKQQEQQIKMLKQKYERAQKYSKDVEQMLNGLMKKKEKLWDEEKKSITQSYERIIKELKTEKQSQAQKQRQNYEKERQKIAGRVENLNEMINKRISEQLKKNEDLNNKMSELVVEIEQLRKQKNKIIKEYTQKLDEMRENKYIQQKQKRIEQRIKQFNFKNAAKPTNLNTTSTVNTIRNERKSNMERSKNDDHNSSCLIQVNHWENMNRKSIQKYKEGQSSFGTLKSLQSTVSYKSGIRKANIRKNNKQNSNPMSIK